MNICCLCEKTDFFETHNPYPIVSATIIYKYSLICCNDCMNTKVLLERIRTGKSAPSKTIIKTLLKVDKL